MIKIPNYSLQILGRKIAFSTFVQLLGQAIELLLAALSIKLISNFLSANDFGIYGTISEYALFFSVAANLGIFANIVRRMADAPHDGKIFINSLFLRIFTALIFFIPAIFYLSVSGASETFLIGAILIFSSLFFDFITSVCNGMLQANYLMGRATFALIAGRLVNFVIIYLIVSKTILIAGTFSLAFLFIGLLTGSLVTMLLDIYFVRAKMKWEWKIDRRFLIEVFLASLPLGLVTIMNHLYFRFLPDYFAHNILNDAQFATFNISFRGAQVASLLSTFLMYSVLPGLKEYIDQKEWDRVKVILKKVWIFLLAAGILLVLIGTLFGQPIIEILTHKKYFLPEFWFILPMMLLLAAISYYYDILLITLYAFEKDWWLVKREVFAITVGLIFFLGSGFLTDTTSKIFLIISGAIAAETFCVIWGLLKTKKVLANTSIVS